MLLQLERLVLRFQTHAYHRALVLVHQRRSVIEAVTEELLSQPDATVTGERLQELLAAPPDAVDAAALQNLPFKELIPDTVCLC
jgi:hypothetical protein